MNELSVSVVVVSRRRPDALRRCLTGLAQLQYPTYEVVVVADPAGLKSAAELPFSSELKLVPFDKPNISAARNLGIVEAAGEIVAFIDDDAVPEPQWLHHLVAPARQSDAAAMGGFVRGRNGISFQWQARSLDRFGEAHEIKLQNDKPVLLNPPKGRAIKTEGTNMAIRRDVLIEIHGFDPAFHYFLDETDLNMRLAQAGYATAIVPLAEVHHGFAANRMRTSDRVPRDLFDIGASWAVFQRKHVVVSERAAQWGRLRSNERRRLLGHMVSGGLEPRAVRQLMHRLDLGYVEGQEREQIATKLAVHPAAPFKRFPTKWRKSTMIGTHPLRFQKDLKAAASRVKNDEIVTLICLSFTAMYHHIALNKDGVWVQRGGLFGKSDRTDPLFRMTTRSRRLEKELRRVARQRGFGKG
ncbi:glycosyltransferase family 2 protein [Sulfitobacter sp. F26204]|uniref:glycosyltransferase family 2 protein n=1 Tax=Sulfitobacter sp. F26204 TaxID=2996014 RepID=UPI00225E1F6F|nr:glycosyltransferase family 2 protein [Sulfitobacter sp. F26204]MCX7558306.1 glycosyltransferase family 2 protein [Sulfitobacter sp. F26204]